MAEHEANSSNKRSVSWSIKNIDDTIKLCRSLKIEKVKK